MKDGANTQSRFSLRFFFWPAANGINCRLLVGHISAQRICLFGRNRPQQMIIPLRTVVRITSWRTYVNPSGVEICCTAHLLPPTIPCRADAEYAISCEIDHDDERNRASAPQYLRFDRLDRPKYAQCHRSSGRPGQFRNFRPDRQRQCRIAGPASEIVGRAAGRHRQ